MAGEEIVGGIKGYLTLDADQFHREILRAIAEAEALDGKKVDVKIDVHGDKVNKELSAIGRNADEAGVSMQRLGTSFGSRGMSMGPLIVGGLAAGFALLGPVTAAATSAVAGFVGIVGVGVLAWRGFKDEIESGSELGKALKTELDGLADAVKRLQGVAAGGAAGGVLAGLEHVREWLPSLNDDVAVLSSRLGSAFNIGTEALTSGLDALMPLLQDGGVYAEKFAIWLRNAAQSQDFKDFVAYAQANLPGFVDSLVSLIKGFTDLAVALAPVGEAIMETFDLIGKGLSAGGKFLSWLRGINEATAVPTLGKTAEGIKAVDVATKSATASATTFTPAVSAQAAALGTTSAALADVKTKQDAHRTAAANATLQMQLENNAAGLLKQGLDALNGEALSAAEAQNAFESSLVNMGTHVTKTGKKVTFTTASINNMSSASVALRGQLNGQVANLQRVVEANGGLSNSTGKARAQMVTMRKQIIDNAVAHGVDRRAVTAYIDKLMKIPRRVPPTKLDVDNARALREIAAVKAALAGVKSRTVTITTIGRFVNNSVRSGSKSMMGGSTVDADGSIYMANGGILGHREPAHTASIIPAGTWRVSGEPETGGEAYIPLSPAKRGRSTRILEKTNELMGNPLGAGTVALDAASVQALAVAMSKIQLSTMVTAGQFDMAMGASR